MKTKTVIFISRADDHRYAIRVPAETSLEAQRRVARMGRFVRFLQSHEKGPTVLNDPVPFDG